MDCTTIYLSMGNGLYNRLNTACTPMHHGLYNTSGRIDFPCNMGCTTDYTSMHHGLYNAMSLPCIMGCTTNIHPMAHALYNYSDHTHIPCIMGCTIDYVSHALWVAQHIWVYNIPLAYGLYNISSGGTYLWTVDYIKWLKSLITYVL